jgi:hypothetical protein
VKNHLARNKVGTVGVNACFATLNLFVSFFLVARVFTLAHENIHAVVLFMLLEVTALIVFYAASSWVCKRTKSTHVLRGATILICVFLLATILFEGQLGREYMIFGFVWGAVEGAYWGATNFIVAEAFTRKTSLSYFVWYLVFVSAVKIIFPVTCGFAIDFGSFVLTGLVVLAVGVAQLLFSFLISVPRHPATNLRMVEYFRSLRRAKFSRPMWILWISTFLWGVPFTLTYLITILVLRSFGSNAGLGAVGSATAVLAVASLFLYKFVSARSHVSGRAMYWVSGALPLLTAVPLFFAVTPATIIIFQIGVVLRNIVETEESNNRANAAKLWGEVTAPAANAVPALNIFPAQLVRAAEDETVPAVAKFNAESLFFLETGLYTGRVAACVLLIAAASAPVSWALPAAISLICVCVLGSTAMLAFWKHRFAKQA